MPQLNGRAQLGSLVHSTVVECRPGVNAPATTSKFRSASIRGTETRRLCHDESMSADLTHATTAELFATYAAVLRELLRRKIVRTANAPAGDYAEYLVAEALEGQLAGNSEKSWDVVTREDRRVQVKSRVVPAPNNAGQRQLSPFRSFDFDDLVIVLFSADYSVWRAVLLPAAIAQQAATYRTHVNGHVLFATDALLTNPASVDLTEKLRAVTAPR